MENNDNSIHEVSRVLGNIEAKLELHALAHTKILDNLECLQSGFQDSRAAREKLAESVDALNGRVGSLEAKVDTYEKAQTWAKGAVAGVSLFLGAGIFKGLDWLSEVFDKLFRG